MHSHCIHSITYRTRNRRTRRPPVNLRDPGTTKTQPTIINETNAAEALLAVAMNDFRRNPHILRDNEARAAHCTYSPRNNSVLFLVRCARAIARFIVKSLTRRSNSSQRKALTSLTNVNKYSFKKSIIASS